jgi:hypothetical protein
VVDTSIFAKSIMGRREYYKYDKIFLELSNIILPFIPRKKVSTLVKIVAGHVKQKLISMIQLPSADVY